MLERGPTVPEHAGRVANATREVGPNGSGGKHTGTPLVQCGAGAWPASFDPDTLDP